MTVVAWFQVIVGVTMVAIWTVLLATRQVPGISRGERDIWFHLTAELTTAAVLISAGATLLLTDAGTTVQLYAALGLGALVYTAVNSAGYYADSGQWVAVGTFVMLAVASIAASIILLTG